MARVLALVSFKIFPAHMGGQKGVALFYQYLASYHDIVMAVSDDHHEAFETAFPVHTILRPNRRMPLNCFKLAELKKLIRETKPDVIVAEHSYTGWLAYLLKKQTGIPFIIHSHNLEAFRFQQMGRAWWRGYLRYEKWIHKQADHSFFISREDQVKAIRVMGIPERVSTVVPYGVEVPVRIRYAREELRKNLNIHSKYLLHFNGTMDYEPNMEAVQHLCEEVAPRLKQQQPDATIIVSGKRLPIALQEKIKQAGNMVYTDFLPDINLVYQGVDLFMNPVTNDSGVKTKLIEALSQGCAVVSTISGAAGMPADLAANLLTTCPDGEWDNFVSAVVNRLNQPKSSTPQVFFEYFGWMNIAGRAAEVITQIKKK